MSNSIAPGSSADVNVRVTALTTNPNVPVTYKTIILKKNLVNEVNTLTQEMMSAQNIKYVVKYDYVLGEDIDVPENCILEFDGGSINGDGNTITLNRAKILAGREKIFSNISISQEKNLALKTSWFGLNALEDCGSVLTSLLNSIAEDSTLYIDTQIKVNSPVTPSATLLFSKIIGVMDNTEVINPYMITSTMAPSTSADTSLFAIRAEGLYLENISVYWNSNVQTTYNTYIFNLTPRNQEGDNEIYNCRLIKTIDSAGAIIRQRGRGLLVTKCMFNSTVNTKIKDGIPPSAIEIVGAGMSDDTPSFQYPENSMRRICIDNNIFHNGNCYMVKFLQNPDCVNTTFVNACIRNNSSDVNMGCLWSNAKHRGLLFTGNVCTGLNNSKIQQTYFSNFYFGNYFDGVKISNNSFISYKDEHTNGEIKVELANVGDVYGSIDVSDNYYDLTELSSILFFVCSHYSVDTWIENVTIKNNVFSSNTFKYPGNSSNFKDIFMFNVNIKKLLLNNNFRASELKQGEVFVDAYDGIISKGIFLFNEGFNSVVTDLDSSSVIVKDNDIINS